MKSRDVQPALVCFVLLLAGCKGGSELSSSPVLPHAPSPLPSLAPSNLANWRADSRVLAETGPPRACGSGTSTGETRTGVDWRVTITGESILLEEDMRNWPTDHIPFSGTLSGRQFSATYATGDDYAQYACQFKGGTLTGTFSGDFSSFEASETLVWGPPGSETTVQRSWIGSRL